MIVSKKIVKVTLFPRTVGRLLSRVDFCIGVFQEKEVQRALQAEGTNYLRDAPEVSSLL